ncbi:MAG: NUDIX domain-containing protein [Methanobacterium sp.]|uniref:NUDIX hydrolase n=1 Tax=Methanobacterium sp. TaxID=2164 RepID=UPI003D64F26A|nr:NUDIX domain-containing protein [Methanobacterium sp.]
MIEYVFGLAVRILLTDDDGKILILKRSTDSKTNSGKWELPGGKVDQGESFDHALIREVYEETKLKVALDHVVGVCQQNLPFIRAIHIVMSGKAVEGELTISPEHEGYAWVFFEDLQHYELADWLEDFVLRQINPNYNSDEDNGDKGTSETILNPLKGSIKSSMDKILGKH